MTAPRVARRVAVPAAPAGAVVPFQGEERSVVLIWTLLLFNGLPYIDLQTGLGIPQRFNQLLQFAALGAALVLALRVNPRLRVRASIVLLLLTALLLVSLVSGMRMYVGASSPFRSMRFGVFLTVLWLLTPWWGRPDLLLLRAHLRALQVVCGIVTFWLLLLPGKALFNHGRLEGVLPAIAAPQVAEFAALMAGITFLLWLCELVSWQRLAAAGGGGVLIVLLSHTRTALVALVLGLSLAGLSLFTAHRRVRRTVAGLFWASPLLVLPGAVLFPAWFLRGQSTEQLSTLTGRKLVWEPLLSAPRTGFQQLFGVGLTNKSFGGLPIDSSWLTIYHEEGRIGLAIAGAILLTLLYLPLLRPPGPARAIAVFLTVYCCVASYTETGLGDASPYILTVVAAASLLASAPLPRTRPLREVSS